LAVAALYKQSPSESRALSSFISIMQANPELASQFSLVVYDNSPEVQQGRNDFAHHYVHDPTNGGLVAAYDYALLRAEKMGCEWLLLLDQDTILTREFFFELIACISTLRIEDKVAAIVPKLLAQGIIQSPAEHFIDYIRHQFARSPDTSSREVVGVQRGRVYPTRPSTPIDGRLSKGILAGLSGPCHLPCSLQCRLPCVCIARRA
jgi:hypothetical protein